MHAAHRTKRHTTDQVLFGIFPNEGVLAHKVQSSETSVRSVMQNEEFLCLLFWILSFVSFNMYVEAPSFVLYLEAHSGYHFNDGRRRLSKIV